MIGAALTLGALLRVGPEFGLSVPGLSDGIDGSDDGLLEGTTDTDAERISRVIGLAGLVSSASALDVAVFSSISYAGLSIVGGSTIEPHCWCVIGALRVRGPFL